MTQQYDVAIVGCGAMGSAAAAQLAKRGQRVLALERFDIPHAMGSSHGVNRIIRLAYHEHPSYVPLLRRAYEMWRDLEREVDEQLLHITGSIDASLPDGRVFLGALNSCTAFGLAHEVLTGSELHRRFPGYGLPDEYVALYQPDGGFLLSERCIVANTTIALANGADIHAREQVLGWQATGAGIEIKSDRSTYLAGKLIVSAGAWMGKLVPELRGLLTPERQVLGWFQPRTQEAFQPETFPVFNMTVEEGHYYGFPQFGIPGVKFGKYHHFEERVDPDAMRREAELRDEQVLRQFIERYFPAAAGLVMTLKSCIFTNSPDEHFIIDRLPGYDEVIVASPCSGHGFKFAAVVGEILADLAITGSTSHDVDLFRLDRFAGVKAAV